MKIKAYEDGSARLLWDWRDIALTTANFETLRAFFQAERDDALGRWRDPENPDMVCYPVAYDLDAVLVMYEGDMTRYYATRSTWKDVTPYYVSETAGRYFAAHPEPKPWENAKEGDYWVQTIGSEPSLWHQGVRRQFWTNGERLSVTDLKDATAGHRIWPEEDK